MINNAVCGKNMKNVRKHRDIRLVTTEKTRSFLVSEPHYRTTKFFTDNLLLLLLLLLFINVSTGSSYQLQLTVFQKSPA